MITLIRKAPRIWSFFAFIMALALPVVATAQNVAQGYKSDEKLQKGMIVRLKEGDGGVVQSLKQTEAKSMLGVVIAASDAPVSLSDTTNQQVFVAGMGQYDILVSTQNGVIQVGDYITISAVNGVGMKSDDKSEIIVGKALGSFQGTTDAESTTTLTTGSGTKTISLGRILVDVTVAHNPFYQGQSVAGVPGFLSKAAGAVTTRPVGAIRIYASLVVLFLGILIAGTVIFSGVRSGMVAIGRNPLAKKSIVRNLVQVTLMALIIFIICLIAVYLLLRI